VRRSQATEREHVGTMQESERKTKGVRSFGDIALHFYHLVKEQIITALCGTTGAGAFFCFLFLNFPLEQSLWGQF
jgi:hypothetical protein